MNIRDVKGNAMSTRTKGIGFQVNGFTLKMIAVVTMLIDHIAAVLIPDTTLVYVILRGIGRLAFPLYCFLLVEGFVHTKNVKRYLMRLGIFALISEIPFDLAFWGITSDQEYLFHQNVFYTLFIGLVVIYFMRAFELKYKKQFGNYSSILLSLFQCIIAIAGCFVSILLFTDYSALGILLIVSFYSFRGNKLLLTLVVFTLNYYLGGVLQAFGTISMIFIMLYNGERGPQGNKYFFYAFYPAHIFVIYLISLLPRFNL